MFLSLRGNPVPLAPVLRGEGLGVRGTTSLKTAPHPRPLPGVPGRGEIEFRRISGQLTLRNHELERLSCYVFGRDRIPTYF